MNKPDRETASETINSFEEACRHAVMVEELRNMCEWPAEFWLDGERSLDKYVFEGKG